MFSTWSVLRFFSDRQARLMPYWSAEESLGMLQLLKAVVNRIDLPQLLQDAYSGSFCIDYEQFTQSALINPEANPYALLSQTGYLTLTKPYVNGDPVYLDSPNKEISMAFANLVTKQMFQSRFRYTSEYSKRTVEVLASLNPEKIQAYFNALFAALPYEHYPVHSESMVAALINFNLRGAGLRPRCEVSESKGRADAEVDLKEHGLTVVFEYKYTDSADPQQQDAKLEEALAQLKERDYGHTADCQPRIARFGLVFCGAKDQRMILRLALADIVTKD